MGNLIGGGSQTIGFRYYLGIHMGLCCGPIDEIVQIDVGDRQAWPKAEGATVAEPPITSSGDYLIKAGNLFGGDKKEGGVEGTLSVYMGEPTQVFSPAAKTLLGGDVPDFRGAVTAFFNGLICTLNPYPKPWKFRLRRILQDWDGPVWQPDLAVISLDDGKIRAMNPAHILYECSTNRKWGRGLPRERINEASWAEAAFTLKNENFGLCMKWNRRVELQEFVETVLSHIGGVIYVSRETGLLELKLFRDDYLPAALPLFDYNSGLLEIVPEVAANEPMVNEIVVKYVSPIDNKEREVRQHNLASIQASGGAINNSTKSYDGLPTFELASRVAQRDLRVAAAAGRRFKITLDRRAWRMHPGAVFKVQALDKSVPETIVRAGKVSDAGSGLDRKIVVEAVIDVFGLSASANLVKQEDNWILPSLVPVPVTRRRAREVTYQELVGVVSPADLALIPETTGAVCGFAARPQPMALSFGLATRTGSDDYAVRVNDTFSPVAVLAGPVGYYDTAIPFNGGFEMSSIVLGTLVQINSEIVKIVSISYGIDGLTGTLTVERGCVDTPPVQHASGSVCYFFYRTIAISPQEFSVGEVVDVKHLTQTSTAQLDPALATNIPLTISGRQGKPYPPGNVRINGTLAYNVSAVSGALVLTWAHRDRKLQQDQIVSHLAASVGPEAGVTYTLRIYRVSGNVLLETMSGITGDTATVNTAHTGDLRLELEAVRGTNASLFRYTFLINRT